MREATYRLGEFARFLPWILLALLASGLSASARDLSTMGAGEIKLLQQRLQDAGCYEGANDGELSGALAAAVKACPDQEPALRIETGMHSGTISMGVDAQCRLAATGSDDKTIRIWSLPEGQLLRVIRPPIATGNGGKIYTVAMSPDGRFVAAGGWDAHDDVDGKMAISIFDAATGAMIARVGAFDDTIDHLLYSGDGRWLAVLSGKRVGLRVFDTATWREVAADARYSDDGDGLAFGPDGRLYTAAADGKIRRYSAGPKFEREVVISSHGGRRPYSIAIAPDGKRIAVGFLDTTAIDIYDASSFAVRAADTRRIDHGYLGEVAWRSDGNALISGGGYDVALGKFPFILFDPDGRRLKDPSAALAASSIQSLAPCGDGFAVASGDPAFGLVDGSGEQRIWRRSVGADLRFKVGDAFQVARDGAIVRFGLGYGAEQPVVFDLRRATLSDSSNAPPGLNKPIVATLPIQNWFNQTNPTFAGKPIELKRYEISRSLAIRPSGRGFALGTDWYIRGYNEGNRFWYVESASAVWGLNISPDDRLVVAAYGDGTIRWHRVEDGRELLALFVNRETKAWVAWTPTGYYMASPGGEDLIGWHVNRGWNQAADFFPASRFRDRFNRPDIVELVLDTLDEDAAVKQANAKAHRREETQPLVAQLPPLIRIADPPDGGRFDSAQAKIDYVWRSPSGLPVEAIEVQIDGRKLKEETLPVRPADANAEIKGSLTVTLPPHDVQVGLIAFSGDFKSEVAAVKLTWTGPVPPTAPPRHLHALIAGVSDYAAPEMALAYAAKDARDFAHALEGQKGGYYADVETRVIVDRDVTRASLIDGLDWLAKQAGPEDVSVLFLAGHGVTDANLAYWYLPSDATEEQAHGRGLSQDDVQRALRSAPGRVIWFLDTCHAGGAATRSAVDVNRLVTTVASAENGGIVAFASSQGNETSLESSVWKNGAFTKALVDGIENGQAAAFGQDAIKIRLLEAYLEARVGELTKHAQTPTMQLPPQVADFVIAVKKTQP